MNRYLAKFNGRRNNAIGATYDMTAICYGADEDEARIALYKRFEHITRASFQRLPGTLYDAVIELGIEHDNHESDLYIPDNELTRELVAAFGHGSEKFRSNVDGKPWLDVPFQFVPFWQKREAR